MNESPGPGAADSQPSLGVLMFIPYRHMEERVLEAVAAAGHQITLAQARVFQRIDQHGSRLSKIAESAQMSKQAAKFLVDQLERGGYVERAPDPSDGRARLVCITPRGHDVIRVASVEEHKIEAEWAAHLGGPATEELRRALLRLRDITDPYR